MTAKVAMLLLPVLLAAGGASSRGEGASLPTAGNLTPDSVRDFEFIQNQIKKVLPGALKTLVSVQTDTNQGSGVLISSDGLVYTAAHVIHSPDEENHCSVILSNGRVVVGALIAEDGETDAAVIKIPFTKGKAPAMASGMPRVGEWVFSLGHAGGYDPGRGAVVRIGRVVSIKNGLVQTDCKLISGDSGGGLFNLSGELVAVHSKVGAGLDDNVHIPVSFFQMLVKRES